MRMEDYQKWLDEQFVDESRQPVRDPSEDAEAPDEEPAETEAVAPALLIRAAPPSPAPPTYSAPLEAEPPAPRPIYVEPQPLASSSSPTASVDEPAIPTLDEYIPFLRSRVPAPAEAEPRLVEPDEPRAPEKQPAASEESAAPQSLDSPMLKAEPPKRPVEVQSRDSEPLTAAPARAAERPEPAEAPRARQARPALAAEPVPPLEPDRLWNLVPRHLQVLLAIEPDEVAQNSYKRPFKESRIELVSRLLDPTLSLEDTARLLNVCPTTVRRYTNKGMLTHQRTQGDQRRFKLSDVLAFLEAQSRKEA